MPWNLAKSVTAGKVVNTPSVIPNHIAIIMDGNGRWAKKKNRPRGFGHKAGAKALRACIEGCGRLGIGTLTVFAFSSENWNRPASEITQLMNLFIRALEKETRELHQNDICLRFIGDTSVFKPALQKKMREAEALTPNACLKASMKASFPLMILMKSNSPVFSQWQTRQNRN